MSVKFNGDIVDRYKANYRVDSEKKTVVVHRLNIKITGEAMEKVEIFKLNVPKHFIG